MSIPREDGNAELTIRVLTLNCWGLWWVSKLRPQRIRGIVRFIRENNCDVVFLQEVWVPSDFEFIRSNTRDIYRFAHHYKSGSFLKSSGIVILCKWLPKVIHFEPYSLNGSPFYFWHGDWFAGKGVAYSRVDLDRLSLHLFSTHTHAYYNENEAVYDQYSIHRVCQSYQLARFINFISDTACNRNSNSIDVIIVAGDFNSTSAELPYKILTSVADLTDCFKMSRYQKTGSNIIHNYKPKSQVFDLYSEDDCSVEFQMGRGTFDSDTEDEDATYCHPKNTFTGNKSFKSSKSAIRLAKTSTGSQNRLVGNVSSGDVSIGMNEVKVNQKNLKESKAKRSKRKRIDFILCRLMTHGRCVIDRITVQGKDPTLDCSLSDHEPVMVELKIGHHNDSNPSSSRNSDISLRPSSSFHIFDSIKNDISKLEETTLSKLTLQDHFPTMQTYHDCNITVIEDFQKILLQYYKGNGKSRSKLLCIILFIFLSTMPIVTYFTITSELLPTSTVIFMWLFASLLIAFGILAGYVSHRIEQSAIEAVLSDLTCRISVARYHQAATPSSHLDK